MFHFHLQHLRSVCIRGKALGKARTADPQYFAARRQQRQLDISRLAGAQDKTSIQRSYSSIIRLIF